MKNIYGVAMLPTEDMTTLASDGENTTILPNAELGLVDDQCMGFDYKYQHLMFLSEEPIREGNWYYDLSTECYEQAFGDDVLAANEWKEDCKKIVAITDPKLTLMSVQLQETGYCKPDTLLPQIPQSFVESYAKNPVSIVTLECDVNSDKTTSLVLINNEVVVIDSFNPKVLTEEDLREIRIDAYEPVTFGSEIDTREPKLYTSDQVKQIADNLLSKLEIDSFEVQDLYDEWYEENLK